MWEIDELPSEDLIFHTLEAGVPKDAAHTSEYVVPALKTLELHHVVPTSEGGYRAELIIDVLGTPKEIVWHGTGLQCQASMNFMVPLRIGPGIVIRCQVYNLTGVPSVMQNTFLGRLLPKI
jgi:hypothetical protein